MLKTSYSSSVQLDTKDSNKELNYNNVFFLKLVAFILINEKESVSLTTIKKELNTNYSYLLSLLEDNYRYLIIKGNKTDLKNLPENIKIGINQRGKEYFYLNLKSYLS